MKNVCPMQTAVAPVVVAAASQTAPITPLVIAATVHVPIDAQIGPVAW